MNESKLAYCSFLLAQIERIPRWRLGPTDWPRIFDLCDRFERVLASVVTEPMVWEGDYA